MRSLKLISSAALLVILTTGFYFTVLGLAAFIAPVRAGRFLKAFAGSAKLHFVELGLRLVVGAAFVERGPSLPAALLFIAFGWILMTSTAVLLVVPWQQHRRFAEMTVPRAIRHLRVIAAISLIVGLLIISAVL